MKKLLVLSVVLFLSSSVFAQTKKGNIFLSGGTGLQFTSTSIKNYYDGESDGSSTGSSLSIVPSFAYFIIDNLAIGLTSNFVSASSKNYSGSKNVSNSITLLPTALYFFPNEGKMKPFAQVAFGISSATEKYIPKTGSDQKSSSSGLAANIGAGIAYFVKENISLNFGLSYTMVTTKDGDDSKSKTKQGNFGSNIGLAIYF